MTLGQSVGQADVWSDVPPPHSHPKERHLVAKSSTTSGHCDIWSALGQVDLFI